MTIALKRDSKQRSGNRDTAGVRRVEQALEHIEQGIRDGRYLPGHRLVEAELAENSGLNIGPIREALRVLAGEGLIEIRPYRGAIVTRLSIDQIAQVYQAAKGVIYAGLELAAKDCQSGENKKRITSAMSNIENAAERPLTDLLMALTEYHLELYRIADNPYLTVLIKRLHLGLVHREVANLNISFDRAAIVTAYAKTTEALIAGDFETARKLQFRHLDSYIELVEEAKTAG